MRAGFDAATRGAKESFQIARYGEQGAIQKGMRKIGSTSDALFGSVRTNSRIGQAYIDIVTRAHGVAYRLGKGICLYAGHRIPREAPGAERGRRSCPREGVNGLASGGNGVCGRRVRREGGIPEQQ